MITMTNICKAFNQRPVLVDVSCEIPDGGVLRLTGPNGAGKSTLLKIVLGLVRPDSGTLANVLGRPAAAVFQEDRLCPGLSAIGNVRLAVANLSPTAAEAELARLGLPPTAMHGPVSKLSGGQRRRVALARALAAPAEIVCLDEPFTGIDADSLPAITAVLLERLAGKTVLLVTHDDALAVPFGGAVLPLPAHEAAL